MKRIVASAILCAALARPAFAADRKLSVTLDGRPFSRNGAVALVHDGIAYANVVELVRAYGGVVSLAPGSVRVTVRAHEARFVRGDASASVDRVRRTMPGPAILEGDVLFLPLAFFVTTVADGRVAVDLAAGTANIVVGANVRATDAP